MYLLLWFSVVPLHGLGTTVILTFHGDPDPETVSHLSQWSVYTRERDVCNGCQKAFEQGLDADYAHSIAIELPLATASITKEFPNDNWIHIGPSFFPPAAQGLK
jgi:hypothetical protein